MTGAPFIVFSLPRSRSAWLSVFLSGPNAPVGHDVGADCTDPADFMAKVRGLRGTCETGAAFAWKMIRAEIPDARFAVVLRDPRTVSASLERIGFPGQSDEMWKRWGHLQDIRVDPEVFTTTFDVLRDEHEAAALYRHCTGEEVPAGWWAQLDPLNIQVDMPRWVAKLQRNYHQIQALKAASIDRMAHA